LASFCRLKLAGGNAAVTGGGLTLDDTRWKSLVRAGRIRATKRVRVAPCNIWGGGVQRLRPARGEPEADHLVQDEQGSGTAGRVGNLGKKAERCRSAPMPPWCWCSTRNVSGGVAPHVTLSAPCVAPLVLPLEGGLQDPQKALSC